MGLNLGFALSADDDVSSAECCGVAHEEGGFETEPVHLLGVRHVCDVEHDGAEPLELHVSFLLRLAEFRKGDFVDVLSDAAHG